MSISKILAVLKDVSMRIVMLMLALILVMLVASRNVEYELEQEALNEGTAITQTTARP